MSTEPAWGAADAYPFEPPPEDERPDAYIEQLENTRAEDVLEQEIAGKLRRLRIDEEARRRHAAEKEADVDLDALFLTRDQLGSLPKPEQLIGGVLPRHSLGILRGRDGTFKTFVAIDWALSLATGRRWQGKPTEQVRVLYIAGEGAHGLDARVSAWEQAWNLAVAPEAFVSRSAALNLHAPGPAFEHLLARLEAGHFGLVVVDTLRRVSGSADGNTSDMGAVIDNLDRVRRATVDGTVLVLAHTAKDDRDTRGFSGIEDDADFVWHAKRDEKAMDLELTCTKMKDGPDGHAHSLRAREAHGSLIIEATSGDARPAPIATENQIKIVRTLQDVFPDGASSSTLMKASEVADSSYYRAISELRDRGIIENTGTPTRTWYQLVSTPSAPELLPSSTGAEKPEMTGVLPLLPPDSHESGTTPTTPTTLRSGSTGVNERKQDPKTNPDEEPTP